MLILYVASKYDYGKPEQGYSFEHHNFYDCLLNMGHDILYFDFMTLMQTYGREGMNRRLFEVVQAEKPPLMFTVLYQDELDAPVIHRISQETDTLTFNWFTDDHWRFDNFSRYWAPQFNWVATTADSALPKYAAIGYPNVIKSQWGCNPFLYRKLDLPLVYDLTFVGQPHGNRRQVIQALRDAGINVQTWGAGWDSGRLTQDEMIRVFNQSRINLNLSNASTTITEGWKYTTRRFVARMLNSTTFGRRLKAAAKRQLFKAGGPDRPLASDVDQIKGRNFEVPGCGGLLLTGYAENLEQYYMPGEEVVCFDRLGDLIDKARYYLSHDEERATIAEAGHRRTLQQHTYGHRFTEIFQRMGLPCEPVSAALERTTTFPGQVQEIQ